MTVKQKYLFIFFSLYLLIISNNLNTLTNNFEFNFIGTVLGVSIILFLVLFLLSCAFIFLFKKVTKNIFFYFCLIFFYFICLISTIDPNIPAYDENLKVLISYHLIIAILLTLITIRFKIYNFFIIVSFVTILVNTFYSSTILYKKYTKQNKNLSNNSLIISKKLNLFIISFDNLPFHIIEHQFKKNKDKSYLTDFVFFNKYISTTQSTHSNLMIEVLGNKFLQDKKITNSLFETIEVYRDKLKSDPRNLLNFVKKNDINTKFYGRYNWLINKDELLDFSDIKVIEKFYLTLERFIVPSLERLFTYKIRHLYQTHLRDKYFWESKQSLEQFRKFIKSINNASYTEKVSLSMGHWYFSQVPISLNKNCNFIQNLPQEIQQMVGVGKCSMKLFEKFINTLKAKKIYKNSIIIFKSDSGIHSTMYPKSNVLSRSINNSKYGYSMYRPFLMVKPLNSNRSNKINESIISNLDLINYYCKELNKFIINKSQKNNCKLLGNEDLYNALYFNKTVLNKKIDIVFDNGRKTHYLNESIVKKIDIINGDVDRAFLNFFSD